MRRPEAAKGYQPFVELHQRFGSDAIDPTLGIDACLDKARIAQHSEVF